jgi:hypothetical protein
MSRRLTQIHADKKGFTGSIWSFFDIFLPAGMLGDGLARPKKGVFTGDGGFDFLN